MSSGLQATFGGNPLTERGTCGKLDVQEDGSWLAYALGKTVILRDARKTTVCDTYTEHTKQVTVARFAPNGNYVASADVGGMVRMWAQTHPEKMLKKETPVLGGPIFDLAWDHESKRIVAGGDGGKGFQAKVFVAETGSAQGEITGHQKPIVSVAMRPTKPSTLATASQDFKVGFFKGPPFKFVAMAAEHTNFVQCVRYSGDGKLLASVGSDTQIFLIDAESGDAKGSLPGAANHSGSIFGVSFSPDSKQLLTVAADKTVKLWDIEKSTVVSTWSLGSDAGDMQVACAWTKSSGSRPVTLSLNGDINFLDVTAPDSITRVKSFQGEPQNLSCDWASGSRDVYVGDVLGVVTKFSYDGVGDHISGKGHEGNITGVQAKAGKVWSAGFDDMIRSIEGIEFKRSAAPGGQPIAIAQASKAPEFVAFVTAAKAGVVSDGRVVASVELGFEGCAVGISPNGDKLLVGDKEKKRVVVFDLTDKCSKISKTDKALNDLLAPPNVISFSPDGAWVAVGDRLKEVSLWDGKSFDPKVRQQWVFHTSTINAIAWSPDSLYIASGSVDSQLYVWNPNNPGKKTKIPFAHKGGVTGVDWASPTEIFSCGGDRAVRRWSPDLPKA